MKTLKEIIAESKKYDPSEPLQDAFVAGARFALTGKYYKPSELFKQEESPKQVLLDVGGEEVSTFIPTFEQWWNLYSYKKCRSKAEAKWNRLSLADKADCWKATPAYVANTILPGQKTSPRDERQFRAYPLTYLNGKRWEDEIYISHSPEYERAKQLAAKAERILSDPN